MLVCNGYGDDGGLAYTSSGLLTPLLSNNGVYNDDNTLVKCKCSNPGLSFLTILRPSSVFNYEFIIRNDALPGEVEYFEVTMLPIELTFPLVYNQYQDVCDSHNSILPSWNTADEISLIYNMPVTFVDLSVDKEGTLMWKDRGDIFSYSNYSVVNYTSDVLSALNWNNLVFKQGNSLLTDGIVSQCLIYSTSRTFSLIKITNQIVVEVFGDVVPIVNAGTRRCSVISPNQFGCYYQNVTQISLILNTNYLLCEVRVFDIADTIRVQNY